jgi:hypothetical protein
MPSISDFPARGKITEVRDDLIVFHPVDTTYQLHLQRAERGASMPAVGDRPVELIIRARARKVWTVPSGGLFIAPIFGPPRTVQGRVRYLDERWMVLSAGPHVVIELPVSDAAYDLARGPVEVGALVNVAALPGATFELLAPVEAR